MASKYKSPLIRSRNTSSSSSSSATPVTPVATPPDRSATDERTTFSGSKVLVYDNTPRPSPVAQHWRARGCSSPRFDSPRPSRGSPYQWTPPSQTGGFCDNSWSSQQNNSGGHSTTHRPQFNRYRKQNTNNYPNRNNENDDESYFHPSMLEDPWAPLLNNSANNNE